MYLYLLLFMGLELNLLEVGDEDEGYETINLLDRLQVSHQLLLGLHP